MFYSRMTPILLEGSSKNLLGCCNEGLVEVLDLNLHFPWNPNQDHGTKLALRLRFLWGGTTLKGIWLLKFSQTKTLCHPQGPTSPWGQFGGPPLTFPRVVFTTPISTFLFTREKTFYFNQGLDWFPRKETSLRKIFPPRVLFTQKKGRSGIFKFPNLLQRVPKVPKRETGKNLRNGLTLEEEPSKEGTTRITS